MASTSVPASADFRSASADSTDDFSSPEILSPCSRSSFSVWYTSVSALLPATVLLRVGLGVADHLIDLVLAERRLPGDRHRLLLARGAVLGGHVHDAVGVDVERDLDLRHAARRGREVDELELAECLVELRH